MTITWGACGHPVSTLRTGCRLCGLATWPRALAGERTMRRGRERWHESERQQIRSFWDEDEANAWEFAPASDVERPANNSHADLVICLSGQVARDAVGWTSRDVPFTRLRYDVGTENMGSPEPLCGYMRPPAWNAYAEAGQYTPEAARAFMEMMRTQTAVPDTILLVDRRHSTWWIEPV